MEVLVDEAPNAMEHVQNIHHSALDYEENEDIDCMILEVRWPRVSFKTHKL